MKKSLIALAVAGAMTAPMIAQADATLYGSIRTKIVDTDNTEFTVNDNSSRIGIKFNSELFSGATAFGQFEQAVNSEAGAWSGGRLSYVGAKGDFGTAQIGRFWTPYALWTVFTTDIMDNGTSAGSGYVIGAHRVGEAMAYISPNMGGFQAAAAVIASDAGANSADIVHVAAKYEMDGVMVAGSYLEYDEFGNYDNVFSLGASYSMDALYVGARYEKRAMRNSALDDQTAWELAGSYTMGNTKLLANYVDDEDNTGDQAMSVEVQQKLGEKARVFFALVDKGNDDKGYEAGYRVDF